MFSKTVLKFIFQTFSGNPLLQSNTPSSALKSNVFLLDKELQYKICQSIEGIINFDNVAMFYQFANLFKFPSLEEQTLSYIERNFTVVIKSRNFFELDVVLVEKILSSSRLQISSEIEVFNVANSWIRYNNETRSKYSKRLFLKARYPLLSDMALEHNLSKNSSFKTSKECVELMKEILPNKKDFFKNKSSKWYTTRCCNQTSFNIVLLGGIYSKTKYQAKPAVNENITQTCASDYQTINNLPSTAERLFITEAVYLNGEIYVFSNFYVKSEIKDKDDYFMCISKYSIVTKTWKYLSSMACDVSAQRFCAFMKKIYIIGGDDLTFNAPTDECLEFDTVSHKTRNIERMYDDRKFPSCTVFQGRVVVSGGFNVAGNRNTVEAYDHVADTWSDMPDMIHERCNHSSVGVTNKLFILGSNRYSCEVYDSTCNKFVLLVKSLPTLQERHLEISNKACLIGKKITIFNDDSSTVLCYDTETDKWSEEPCEVTEGIDGICVMRIPKF